MASKHDYLKYWRVIKYFYKKKYNLSESDLEMLLFLNSERRFRRKDFRKYAEIMPWDRTRFDRLVNDGWIQEYNTGTWNKRYQLSGKAERMIISLYKKLNGEEIPTSQSFNPMFAKNVSYTDKVYRNMIKEMNEFIRQQRHSSPQ
jgi:hypothetical protein